MPILRLTLVVILWTPGTAKPVDADAVAFAYQVLQAHHRLAAASVELQIQDEAGTTTSHLHFKDDQVHCTTTGARGYRQIYSDPSIAVVSRAVVKGTLLQENGPPRMRLPPHGLLPAFADFLLRMRRMPPEYFLWNKVLEVDQLHRDENGRTDGFSFRARLSSGTIRVDPKTLLIREVQSESLKQDIHLRYDLRVPTSEQMTFEDPPEGFDVETYLPDR